MILMKLFLPGNNCTVHFESHSVHLNCTEYKLHAVNKYDSQCTIDSPWHRRDTGKSFKCCVVIEDVGWRTREKLYYIDEN